VPDPLELKITPDEAKSAEHRLRNLYAPAALEYLFRVMNDHQEDPELRLEAAIVLATEASVPHYGCDEDESNAA